MSRRPEHRQRPALRRRKSEDDAEATTLPTAADATPATPNKWATRGRARTNRPAEARVTKRKEAAPAVQAAPAESVRARVDADALLAELDGLSQDDFAAMLGGAPRKMPRPGERVEGRIVRMTEAWAFVDLGTKSEGTIDVLELDEDVAVGDQITAFVLRAGDMGIQLARQIRGTADRAVLEEAHAAGLPIEGIVQSRNSGGYVVKFGKTAAFCPISQIDRITPPDPDVMVGQRLDFRITKMDDRGIVVSRRAIAEEAVQEQAEKLWAKVSEGDLLEGTVVDVKAFGAFVDVSGVRGLVPKRELGWGNAAAPRPGSRVTVRVIRVDAEANKLTLSMRDPDAGPWTRVGVDFVEGGVYEGTVARVKEFGAFVTLSPGLDGLVPVRHLAEERVDDPTSVVREGQTVRVRIMGIDSGRERLELSIRHAIGADIDTVDSTATRRRSSGNASLGTFGDLMAGLKLPTKRR